MVSSVQPSNYAPPTPLPPNPRLPQTGNDNSSTSGDVVSLSGALALDAVHESLDAARSQSDLALAAGREGAGLLSQLRDVARQAVSAPDDQSRAGLQNSFQSLLQRYGDTIDAAVDAGAGLLAGQALSVNVDPNAAPVTINGYDLRLKDAPGAEDALRLSAASSIGDASSAQAAARDADASLARVDSALGRISASTQRLSAHDHFLGALDAGVAAQVNEPADADGARLLALQASQALNGQSAAIGNSTPQALLGLFRP